MKPIMYGMAALAIAVSSGCETAVDLAVGSQVDGTWSGKFYCGQGLPLNATLNVHLSLQPVTWLEGLDPNHQMRPIEATLRTDGKTMELPKTQGCSETLLTKQ